MYVTRPEKPDAFRVQSGKMKELVITYINGKRKAGPRNLASFRYSIRGASYRTQIELSIHSGEFENDFHGHVRIPRDKTLIANNVRHAFFPHGSVGFDEGVKNI